MEKIRLKPCSPILMVLFIGAVLLHQITNGYGSLICLLLAVIVMMGQMLLQHQLTQDLKAIQSALEHKHDWESQQTILALTQRLLQDNQWLTEDSKQALQAIQEQVLSQSAPKAL
ncbi:MAG: hypothetical protein Q4B71_07550 [Cardiobacteriaceae bacterium]|nr:hypothetical protein [Cardiobacteriaceae bacterium]